MRTAMLKRTVKRLADLAGSSGPCPFCAGREPVLLRGEQEVPACPVCGRGLPAVRLIHDSNFYGNADRLRQVGALDTR
jgi:hypothetical protein